MLKFINEELFSFNISNYTDYKNGRSYTKLIVANSSKLQQEKRNRDQEIPGHKPAKYQIKVNTNELESINREMFKISAPILKDTKDSKGLSSKSVDLTKPMSVNISSTNGINQFVELRCHDKGDDRANVYAIAFPFNGMINPIELDNRYRIYKGAIVPSKTPIYFNGRRYKKVLYLIVEINKNLFNPEHKYHTDKVDISVESYAIFDNRETGTKNTNYEKMTLSIYNDKGESSISWQYDLMDKPIYVKVEPGTDLWTQFRFDKKEEDNTQTESKTRPHNNDNRNNNRYNDSHNREAKDNSRPTYTYDRNRNTNNHDNRSSQHTKDSSSDNHYSESNYGKNTRKSSRDKNHNSGKQGGKNNRRDKWN